MEVHLGMDDIDSPRGGCTTHFASILVGELEKWGVSWMDYPNLIRLNPNIPFRTRGNGAVALRFTLDESRVDDLLPRVKKIIEEYLQEDYPNTNPGVVLVKGGLPHRIRTLSEKALWRTVPITYVSRLIDDLSIESISSGNGRGLIGALSAVGNTISDDHTYELITYRTLENSDKDRNVDVASVFRMDRRFEGQVFANIDPTTGSILIEPHGPDPVIYGLRGESASSVIEASKYIITGLEIDMWTVFRTNQGTGEHLKHRASIKDLRPYMAIRVEGRVSKKPYMIEGGHAIFSIEDRTGSIDCAVYEPAGEFRKIVLDLILGDKVIINGGVRPASRSHGLTLNIEGLVVLNLAESIVYRNPICPNCSKRLKSAGKDKGYKCFKCGYRDPDAERSAQRITRQLKKRLYLPPPRSQRHLTRPITRLEKKNSGAPSTLIEPWHMN